MSSDPYVSIFQLEISIRIDLGIDLILHITIQGITEINTYVTDTED